MVISDGFKPRSQKTLDVREEARQRLEEPDPYTPVRVATCPVCKGDVMRLFRAVDYDSWITPISAPIAQKPYLACVGHCKIGFTDIPEERPWQGSDVTSEEMATQHLVIIELPEGSDGSLKAIAEAIANPACRVVHAKGSDEEVYAQLIQFLDDLEKKKEGGEIVFV